MARNSQEESLAKQNRRLKEENRHLKKMVKRLSRGSNRIEELEEAVEDLSMELATIEPDDKTKCPECNKGTIEEVDLSVRTMFKCSKNCGYRKVIKK
jgi:chromosome segregation ATPase